MVCPLDVHRDVYPTTKDEFDDWDNDQSDAFDVGFECFIYSEVRYAEVEVYFGCTV